MYESILLPSARANSSRFRFCNVNKSFASCCVIVDAPPELPKLEIDRIKAQKSTPECSKNRSSSVEIKASKT